eukprot:scaffold29127_cov78-Phaeocystis_antarctica.AAC.4
MNSAPQQQPGRIHPGVDNASLKNAPCHPRKVQFYQPMAEQEMTEPSAADSGIAPAAPAPLAASIVGPSPALRHANSSAPPKRPALPESASARRAKTTFTSPWHVYCQEQRPLLMPL